MERRDRLFDHRGLFRHAARRRAAGRAGQRPAGGADRGSRSKSYSAFLIAPNFLTGEADGRLGTTTRAAVKQAQLKVGLPADAYPTQELTERLRAGR